jgi:hypothetical protein
MRLSFALIPLLISAAPALAQEPAEPAPGSQIQVPSELTDPATANKLANAMQALSKAFLELPVGEVQAAIEGRKPTAAEKKLTLRDLERRSDPNFERDFRRQMADAKPKIEQSMKALADALPSMMQGLQRAQQSLERAAANMPDPTYPKR